ncbi:MBL fold metallo-hydrolase [Sphingomonas panacisoli]|uniref:MBL fold metallo-hydrolase n=1 Tax=Sphingomonas panacisoli TaxID=1813879 RepID=A0A5B8LKQ6_9SPHN|nr:MBL fold metallo-hydrolase [Sphingomonas panacisoli]QDZ08626.1 MBL fold metallo-hydrolase [Sphingomonas panacisoli]
MRVWIKRILLTVAALLAVAVGYGAWRFGHPALPADTVTLASSNAAAGDVTARYFGATTLTFGDGKNTIMIDALLTRPGMRAVMFDKIASDPALVGSVLSRAGLAKIDLLLVSHTHYDHALDIAAVAAKTGATIVGSPSTREVALGGGIPDARIRTIKGGETLVAGDFTVTVIRSAHSLGDRVPGEVTAPLRQPAKASDYREGGTFAYLIEHRGLRILVHASANFSPGMYRGVKADVVFLATGGLSPHPADFTARYWDEVVKTTGAKLVVPIHWDDFLLPLDQPLQPLRRFLDDIPLTMTRLAPLAARDGVKIRYMPVIAPVDINEAKGK